jgi:hypothetical protein
MSSVCVLAIIPSPKGTAPASCSCRLSRNATVQQAIIEIGRQARLSLNVHDIVINGHLFSGERSSTELAAVCDGPTVVMLIEEKRSRSVPEAASVADVATSQKRDFAPELLARFEPTQLEQHQRMMSLHHQRMPSMDTIPPASARRGAPHVAQPPPSLREPAQSSSQPDRAFSGGSSRIADSLVKEENIMSLLQLGISREDAVRALSSSTSVDAAASMVMSNIWGDHDAVPLGRSSSAPAALGSELVTRASSASAVHSRISSTPSSLSSSLPLPPSQTAVWDRTLRCIAVAAQGNTFAQEVLMCFRVPMMLKHNLSIAAALQPIFHGERRLGNITNWERSSAANDLMLKAIDYCNILDANSSAVPVPPPGCDAEVWEDSIILGRPSDALFDKFFADSKEQISQVRFVSHLTLSHYTIQFCFHHELSDERQHFDTPCIKLINFPDRPHL